MATVFRRRGSPFYQTAYFDAEGRRHFRTTRKRNRIEAITAAAQNEWKRTTAADTERSRRTCILEEAAKAIQGGHRSVCRCRIKEPTPGPELRGMGHRLARADRNVQVRWDLRSLLSFLASLFTLQKISPDRIDLAGGCPGFRDSVLKQGCSHTTANIAVACPVERDPSAGTDHSQPCGGRRSPSGHSLRARIFSPEQIARIVHLADGDWEGLVLAGYYTGARHRENSSASLGNCGRRTITSAEKDEAAASNTGLSPMALRPSLPRQSHPALINSPWPTPSFPGAPAAYGHASKAIDDANPHKLETLRHAVERQANGPEADSRQNLNLAHPHDDDAEPRSREICPAARPSSFDSMPRDLGVSLRESAS